MLKKFFVLIIFSACLACSATSNAQSLYSGNVSNVINAFKIVGNELGFSLWGTEYYTYKGIKRCELHFGNTGDNLIRFRLNNDNSVARVLITIPNSYEAGFQAGALSAAVCISFGRVQENEYKKMWESVILDVFDNLSAGHIHKKYYAWSPILKQYITMDVEMYTSKCDLYFYVD